jgi:hypothetical protein
VAELFRHHVVEDVAGDLRSFARGKGGAEVDIFFVDDLAEERLFVFGGIGEIFEVIERDA